MLEAQDIWTASLLIPALILGAVAWRQSRAGRTTLGLGLREGAVGEFAKGCLFAVPFFVVLLAVYDLTGLTGDVGWQGGWLTPIGVAAFFLVLFLLEEVVFRGLLMTGLGVLAGRWVALFGTAVVVADAYAFAPTTGVLPMIGAVITNVMTGLARWRTGRIWWGLGHRWLWNSLIVAFGFNDAGFSIADGLMRQPLAGPDSLTGGAFGIEGGLVGIGFLLVMIGGILKFARGRRGGWTINRTANGADAREPVRP